MQMRKDNLTFGIKINCTFAALAAVLGLTAWFGFHMEGSLRDSMELAARIVQVRQGRPELALSATWPQ